MNYYQDELTAQYNRQRIQEDFDQIRLEQRSAKARVHRPGLFTRTMHSFSTWMISAGRELHERYELPIEHSHGTRSGFFAH
ncbi:MAG TPA: hypothetical protein VK851_05645 [Anaerolineales bacterium]|nr:hypothetical protein [Anaerolineales bacterium]